MSNMNSAREAQRPLLGKPEDDDDARNQKRKLSAAFFFLGLLKWVVEQGA